MAEASEEDIKKRMYEILTATNEDFKNTSLLDSKVATRILDIFYDAKKNGQNLSEEISSLIDKKKEEDPEKPLTLSGEECKLLIKQYRQSHEEQRQEKENTGVSNAGATQLSRSQEKLPILFQ